MISNIKNNITIKSSIPTPPFYQRCQNNRTYTLALRALYHVMAHLVKISITLTGELEDTPSNKISFAEQKFPIVSRNVCGAPSGAWGVRCPVRKCLSCSLPSFWKLAPGIPKGIGEDTLWRGTEHLNVSKNKMGRSPARLSWIAIYLCFKIP